MLEERTEAENCETARKFTFKGFIEYQRIMPKAAASLLCQIEYWWPKKKGLELYKSDQELAKELGISLRLLQYAKNYLSQNNIVSMKVHWKNGKRIPFYKNINYTTIDSLIRANTDAVKRKKPTIVKRKVCTLHSSSKTQSLHDENAKFALYTLYTSTTTDITYNPTGLEKNLSFNESELENPSPEQEPIGNDTALLGREEFSLTQSPIPEPDKSKSVENAVGNPPNPLKEKAVPSVQESKAKSQSSKPTKIVKTKINPGIDLTAERRQIALDIRIEDRGLRESVVESLFEDFVDHFTEKGTKSSNWDLSWKQWCKRAVEWDKYDRKTMINPTRSVVCPSNPATPTITVDQTLAGFVRESLYGNQFIFEDAILTDLQDRIVIDQTNSFKQEQIERITDKLERYLGKRVELEWIKQQAIPSLSQSVLDVAKTTPSTSSTSSIVESSRALEDIAAQDQGFSEKPTVASEMNASISSTLKGIQQTENQLHPLELQGNEESSSVIEERLLEVTKNTLTCSVEKIPTIPPIFPEDEYLLQQPSSSSKAYNGMNYMQRAFQKKLAEENRPPCEEPNVYVASNEDRVEKPSFLPDQMPQSDFPMPSSAPSIDLSIEESSQIQIPNGNLDVATTQITQDSNDLGTNLEQKIEIKDELKPNQILYDMPVLDLPPHKQVKKLRQNNFTSPLFKRSVAFTSSRPQPPQNLLDYANRISEEIKQNLAVRKAKKSQNSLDIPIFDLSPPGPLLEHLNIVSTVDNPL